MAVYTLNLLSAGSLCTKIMLGDYEVSIAQSTTTNQVEVRVYFGPGGVNHVSDQFGGILYQPSGMELCALLCRVREAVTLRSDG